MQNFLANVTDLYPSSQVLFNNYNGPRNTIRMNVERCVALHNEILTIGWMGRGRDPEDLGQSWFDFHGDGANEVRGKLSPDLVAFLEHAWEVDDHSFFYYVNGLHHPANLFTNNLHDKQSKTPRYVTLYAANDLAEHVDGLV